MRLKANGLEREVLLLVGRLWWRRATPHKSVGLLPSMDLSIRSFSTTKLCCMCAQKQIILLVEIVS
jgi:hypothetical protein